MTMFWSGVLTGCVGIIILLILIWVAYVVWLLMSGRYRNITWF